MESGKDSVTYEDEFIRNSRGNELFTCRWMPADTEPKALVFMCHGYAMECSISMRGVGVRLATEGYVVYGMDYEGHGNSSGLRGYIPNFDHVVDDCSDYFTAISERQENKNKKKILLGESYGGAIVLHLHMRRRDYWDMAVLLAPLCKFTEHVTPHPLVLKLYVMLGGLFPKLKLPIADLIDEAVRVPKIRDEIRSNPLFYSSGWHHLGTGIAGLKMSLELEKRLEEVSLPFLVVHGGDDRVSDPSVSQLLYESARSSDKTFNLYRGMWHSLTYGEVPYNINIVLSQIVAWLNDRVA
ncbi:hypothetical protein ACS0TY_031368 [Phlomoides rotata]